MKFARGSEWRKWDLHIHTPASFRWNDGKKLKSMTPQERDTSMKSIIQKINSSDVVAFSVMDYFTFEGVLSIREASAATGGTTLEKTLFPGMELRIEAPVNYRLNIHVIFCDSTTNQQLSDFRSSLLISGINRPLSDEAIIAAARTLPEDKANEYGEANYKTDEQSAFKLGCETIKITRESFDKATKALGSEKCLVILPYDTSDGIEKLDWKKHPHDDVYFLRRADIFETRNKESIDLFQGVQTDKNKTVIQSFIENLGGMAKPVVSGSDAHKISDYGVYPNGKVTWIKADPTFAGLRKTIVEPHARTFVGERPEKLKAVSAKATKFISKIEVKKKADSQFDEIWFNNGVHFNPELVAIIGNKGSGKSALADILGLLGESRQENAFSFLNDLKFREKQGHKAAQFTAGLHWVSEDTTAKLLSDAVDRNAVETIKYIPQSYLEKLCNEISNEAKFFDLELKAVIFSHISQDSRLGHNTLDDLIKYRSEETSQEIGLLRSELKKILELILDCENKLTEQYKKTILSQLSTKQAELEAHTRNRPAEVVKPAVDGSQSPDLQKQIKDLEQVQNDEAKLDAAIVQKKKDLDALSKNAASSQKALLQVDLIEKQVAQMTVQLEILLKELGLQSKDIVILKVDKASLEEAKTKLNADIAAIQNDLNPDNKAGLLSRSMVAKEKVKEISAQIDEPNQKYQKYLEDFDHWNKVKNLIQGDSDKVGTIGYFNSLIAEIGNVPAKITALETKRDELSVAIFKKITGLAETYKQAYAPVQTFVNSNPFADESFKMSFDVSIVDTGFRQKLFNFLNRNRAGTFHGVEESEKALSKMLDKYDFNKEPDTISFVREILNALKFDQREGKKVPVAVSSQLKDGKVLDLYFSIFALEFLEPKYFLRLNGKSLDQLSPGERGTLLLIFYLMVDRDDRPLVIDQPEENLDNQTIFKVLVPCIKNAKRFRQIFLVTHNPNLAVVCDAEQIIVASIEKANRNKVNYLMGAIENPSINKQIVDILEGTRPAFDNRDFKYFT